MGAIGDAQRCREGFHLREMLTISDQGQAEIQTSLMAESDRAEKHVRTFVEAGKATEEAEADRSATLGIVPRGCAKAAMLFGKDVGGSRGQFDIGKSGDGGVVGGRIAFLQRVNGDVVED